MAKTDYIPLIGRLARRQDRLVTRQQLLGADVPSTTINNYREDGYLIDVFPGVYVVGVPYLTQREFLRSCVLHAGPAYPSHRTGIELRELLPATRGEVIVTTQRENVESPVETVNPLIDDDYGHLIVRHATPLVELPTEWVDGFETTLLPRSLIDLAGSEGAWPLRRAWREATFRSVLDPDKIQLELDAHPRGGNRLVRQRLRDAYPVTRPGMDLRSRSGELAFLELVRELGLPEPLVNHPMTIGGRRYRLDFYWEDIGLAIETDGRQHDEPEFKHDDETRRMDFFVAEIDVLHIRNKHLSDKRAWCRTQVLAAYERQRRRAG